MESISKEGYVVVDPYNRLVLTSLTTNRHDSWQAAQANENKSIVELKAAGYSCVRAILTAQIK